MADPELMEKKLQQAIHPSTCSLSELFPARDGVDDIGDMQIINLGGITIFIHQLNIFIEWKQRTVCKVDESDVHIVVKHEVSQCNVENQDFSFVTCYKCVEDLENPAHFLLQGCWRIVLDIVLQVSISVELEDQSIGIYVQAIGNAANTLQSSICFLFAAQIICVHVVIVIRFGAAV